MLCETKYNISTVAEMINVIKEHPDKLDYEMYVSYCDSLYAISDIVESELTLYICSKETYGEGSELTACEFLELLEDYSEVADIVCAPAENLDLDLDMQMDEETEVYGLGISETNKMILIIAN